MNKFCARCDSNGWLVGDDNIAQPCPVCKPNWVHPDLRKADEQAESKDEKRAREAKAVEGDARKWWD